MFYKRQPVDVLIEVTAGREVVAWWGLSRPRSVIAPPTDGNMSCDECQMRDPSNNTIQITTLQILGRSLHLKFSMLFPNRQARSVLYLVLCVQFVQSGFCTDNLSQ